MGIPHINRRWQLSPGLVPLAFWLLTPVPSHGQLNITNSSSHISVSAARNSQTTSDSTNPNGDGYLYVAAPNASLGGSCWAEGALDSSISPTAVSITADANVSTFLVNECVASAVTLSASASTYMYLGFHVSVPQSVQVQRSGTDVSLGGNGTNFFNSNFPSSFILFPGSYTLAVSVYPSWSYSAPAGFCASRFGAGNTFYNSAHVGLQTAPAPGPFIMSLSSNAAFVLGASNALSVQAAGIAPFGYQWRKGGTNIVGATNSTLVFPSATPTDGGLYTVVVTNNNKSITSSVIQVTMVNPPSISQLRRLGNGSFQFTFTNLLAGPVSVLASTNIGLSSTQWVNLGSPALVSNNLYQFTDSTAATNQYRFFRLRWP